MVVVGELIRVGVGGWVRIPSADAFSRFRSLLNDLRGALRRDAVEFSLPLEKKKPITGMFIVVAAALKTNKKKRG